MKNRMTSSISKVGCYNHTGKKGLLEGQDCKESLEIMWSYIDFI